MRTFLVVIAALLFGGCASASPAGATRTFSRPGSPRQPITVRLRWTPDHQPPFYTGRGPIREVTIIEAGRAVSVARAQIAAIEDIWPERVTLDSPRRGDYDLLLPYGVGAGSLAHIRVRAFRVVSVVDVPLAETVPGNGQAPAQSPTRALTRAVE